MNMFKFLLIPLMILFFTACGGGGGVGGGDANGNGTPPNTALAISAKSFSSTPSDGNITLTVTSPNSADISITMDDIKLLADSYNITITSITPASVTFNGSNLTKTLQINFTYINALGLSHINLSNIKVSYRKVVKSNLSNTQSTTNELDENIVLQSAADSSNLLELTANAPVTTLNTANQSIEITLQVNDLNTSPKKPAVGELINIEPISPADGVLDSVSKATDANGRVTFTYTSPDFPKYGTQLDLKIYSDKYPGTNAVLTLNFTAQNDKVVTNMYLAPSGFTITTAGETKTIKIVTVNSQNRGVSTPVTIEQPNNADNVDYGSFNVASLTTDASGSGTIIYTAPNDISGLSDRNITIIEGSTNIQKTLQVKFTQPSTDSNATAYDINATVPNFIALENDGTFVVKIQKVGNPNILIANSDVKDVNVSTQFGQLLTIKDSNYNNASVKTVNVTTHSLAGTAIVNISARIFDGIKDVTLTTSVPITILSGPVAAVSLLYVSTDFDSDLGIFKDKYTIHAIDKYSNPVNNGVQLYPTLINGFKTVSSNGEISTSGSSTYFKDSSASFTNKVSLNDDDHLIILPSMSGFKKDYLGGWTISTIDDNNNLTLAEDYYGADTSSLHYVIGNKERLLGGDTVAVADIQSTTGTYITDENGNVQFIVKYDPILVGHTLSLSAVAYDDNNTRSGIALRSNFRGEGYSYSAEDVANDGGNHNSTIAITILQSGGEPLANVDIVPNSVSVLPKDQCDINQSASNFTTDNNGQFTVSINTKGPSGKCTVSWIAKNSSIFYEY